MRIIGNLLWLVLCGIEMAIAYLIAGVLSILFIVTIPLAIPAFRLAGYTLVALRPCGHPTPDSRKRDGPPPLSLREWWAARVSPWSVTARRSEADGHELADGARRPSFRAGTGRRRSLTSTRDPAAPVVGTATG
jgi:hypothetical protein